MPWYWNTHTSSKNNFENKLNASKNSKYLQQYSHNGFGQNPKRNNTRSGNKTTESPSSNGETHTMWPHDNDNIDIRNSNFWGKVLLNNKNHPNNSSPSSSSTVILNAMYLKEHPKIADGNDIDSNVHNFNVNDAVVPTNSMVSVIPSTSTSTVSISDSTSSQLKNVLQKYHISHNVDSSGDEARIQSSTDNDLSSVNSTFLRALNDLNWDYNDLTVIHQRRQQSTSKNR